MARTQRQTEYIAMIETGNESQPSAQLLLLSNDATAVGCTVSQSFLTATTALQKKDGRCPRDRNRRQLNTAVEARCAPFQFALSTRAGVGCVGHPVRAATDENPEATFRSVNRRSVSL